MKKILTYALSLCLILCIFTSCGSSDSSNSGSSQGEGEAAMHTYKTQEIWVQNGAFKIYGEAYIPDTGGKVPLVIFSHELGNDHTSGERYAKRLA